MVFATHAKLAFHTCARLEASKDVRECVRKVTANHKKADAVKTAGLVLIAMPEPATSVVGVPLFLAGKLMENRLDSVGLRDIMTERDRILRDLRF
jgi:hypothetical protein